MIVFFRVVVIWGFMKRWIVRVCLSFPAIFIFSSWSGDTLTLDSKLIIADFTTFLDIILFGKVEIWHLHCFLLIFMHFIECHWLLFSIFWLLFMLLFRCRILYRHSWALLFIIEQHWIFIEVVCWFTVVFIFSWLCWLWFSTFYGFFCWGVF